MSVDTRFLINMATLAPGNVTEEMEEFFKEKEMPDGWQPAHGATICFEVPGVEYLDCIVDKLMWFEDGSREIFLQTAYYSKDADNGEWSYKTVREGLEAAGFKISPESNPEGQ